MPVVFYAIIGGVTPSFIWLFFWLREDVDHPEPRKLIFFSFVSGLLAVLIAIVGENYVHNFPLDQTTQYSLWAAIEEIVKFIVIAAVALRTSAYDEPIDAMIYMITIALGFSAVENSLFLIDPLSTGQISNSIAIQTMRFMGASLVHVVCSAIVGFSLGVVFYKSALTKTISVLIGLATAIFFHSVFNISIVSFGPGHTFGIFVWIWVAVIILLVLFEEIKAVKAPSIAINSAVHK